MQEISFFLMNQMKFQLIHNQMEIWVRFYSIQFRMKRKSDNLSVREKCETRRQPYKFLLVRYLWWKLGRNPVEFRKENFRHCLIIKQCLIIGKLLKNAVKLGLQWLDKRIVNQWREALKPFGTILIWYYPGSLYRACIMPRGSAL